MGVWKIGDNRSTASLFKYSGSWITGSRGEDDQCAMCACGQAKPTHWWLLILAPVCEYSSQYFTLLALPSFSTHPSSSINTYLPSTRLSHSFLTKSSIPSMPCLGRPIDLPDMDACYENTFSCGSVRDLQSLAFHPFPSIDSVVGHFLKAVIHPFITQ